MKITEASAKLLNPFLDDLSDEFYLQMLLRHVEKMWKNLLFERAEGSGGKHGEVCSDANQKWT